MIIKWFNTREVLAFAEDVTLEVGKLFSVHESRSKLRNAAKEQKKLVALLGRVRAYATKSPLNIYKKAKFLNTIKWKLRDAGHDKQFIDDIVALLAKSLNT
jgi:cytochrome c biogenesis factor